MNKRNSEIEAKDQALFDHIASNYFKKDLLPTSSIARSHRLYQTVKRAGLQPHSKILEVGCGGGFSAKYLKGHYLDYLGIDYSNKMIEYARSHFNIPNASFRPLNIKDLEPSYNDFDIIIMLGVLHHMDNIKDVLLKLRSHLKTGGVVAINEPQSANPFISLLRRLRKKVDSSYSSDQKELSAKDLLNAFADAGYVNVSIYPQGFFSPPFAEVPLKPQFLIKPLSLLACKMDYFLEMLFPRYLSKLSWNLILTAHSPGATR